MRERTFNPRHLDVEAFARAGAELGGELPLASMRRLNDSAHAEARPAADAVVPWRARGEMRVPQGAEASVWLHVEASASMRLVCQRCLGPVDAALQVSRDFRFVQGESAAAELDADSEDDVLALTRALDLPCLLEDELLLELPLVPRHERCPHPLPASAHPDEESPGERENPFAALSALRSRTRS